MKGCRGRGEQKIEGLGIFLPTDGQILPIKGHGVFFILYSEWKLYIQHDEHYLLLRGIRL